MDNSKERYIKICEEYPDIPIFFQPWWLDMVTMNGEWNAVVIENRLSDEIVILPFTTTRKFGLRISVMPPLTPYLGPFVINQDESPDQSEIQELMNQLHDELKVLDYYAQSWLPDMLYLTRVLPEYYQETTRYTYRFRTLQKDEISKHLYPDVKNKIRKAKEAYRIREDILDINLILKFYTEFCEKKKIKLPLDITRLQKLIEECLSRHQGKLYVIENISDQKIAGIQFTVADTKYAYNLLLAIDSDYQSDGIAQKLLWNSISDHVDVGLYYDFEGSMIPGVSKMFKHFGSTHTQYSKVYRDRSKLIKFARIIGGIGNAG